MYFMVKDENNQTICEVGIYADQDIRNTEYWNIVMYVSFNIENYTNYLLSNLDKSTMIKESFTKIQDFVLDLSEHVSGDYPELKQYTLNDPAFNESKSQVIKVTRDRLYSIVNDLGDTGIYVNED